MLTTTTTTTTTTPITKAEYRDAMARLGAAVHIITTDGPAGRAGFTASAVCSVTDEPPTLLVCLNRNASVYDAVKENAVLCVNTLAAGHQELSNLFGGKTAMETRFRAAQWSVDSTGCPVLDDASVSFDCRIVECTSVGTHDVFFCEVQSVRLGNAPHALMYFERQYHEINATPTG
ncbi:MAG: rutF [Rhizobacter sp.]|nr:rutF [Rhizobacter sp.]